MADKVGIEINLKGNVNNALKQVGKTAKTTFSGIGKVAKKATQGIKNLGKSIFSLKGLIAGAGLGLLTKKIVDLTLAQAELQDETIKSSRALGVQVEELSSLRRSAQLGGASVATMDAGLRRLSKNIADSVKGIGDGVDVFRDYNIELTDADGNLRKTTDVLNDVADAFQRTEDGTLKSARAQLLFGKSGVNLINTLNGGSEALREQRKEAERLGIIFSSEAAKDAEKFNDAVLDLGNALSGAFRETLEDILPRLTPLIKELTTDIADNIGSIKEFGTSLFNAFDSALPAIKNVGIEIKNTTKWWLDFITEIGETSRIGRITDLSVKLAKVTSELKEQQEVLDAFKGTGFIPPAVQSNVEALKNRVRELKSELTELRDVSTGGSGGDSEGSPAVERKTQEISELDQLTTDQREKEAQKDLEFQKKQAEEQRAFELKKWSIKTEFEKKKQKQIKATADLEKRLTLQTASLAVSTLKEVFGENKAFAVADIIINTARGIQRSFADLPFPFNGIQAGLIGATGAAQLAKVNGAKFADGGFVQGAGSGRSDSINAQLSDGEFVINAQSTNDNREILEAINSGQNVAPNINVNITAGAGTDLDSLAQTVTNAVQRATQLGLEPSIV